MVELVALTAALAGLAIWSLGVGSTEIPFARMISALLDPGASREDYVLWGVRLPRVLTAVCVGASLAVAGAVMQAVTGNPLADPGLLGVTAGASFAVVLTVALHDGDVARALLIWVAFLGAGAAAALVYVLGSAGRSGATPLKLVLAGVVIGSFLGALTMSILILDAQTFDEVRTWTAGSLRGRQMRDLASAAPYLAAALAAAVALAGQFTALSLGAEAAQGLGQNQALWRGLSAALVVTLAGAAVSVAGPVGFVGLVAPHIARMTVGADYRWIVPFSLLIGAILTLTADTAPRALLQVDAPVGVTLALVGAPYLIWLVRRPAKRMGRRFG